MAIILNTKENVYEQIVSKYKQMIELNIIRYEEKLPSCRELAKELGINPNTVSKAYSVLEEDGYIHSIPKKGVYVIYNNDKSNHLELLESQLIELKNQGYSYQELLDGINKIYRGDNND